MNKCPITYQPCVHKYSEQGLKLIAPSLKNLHDFPFTSKEQNQLATQMASKLSIQGVQPKLSIGLNGTKEIFEIKEKGGRFILKPPHQMFEEVPQNEDLSMKLASLVEIEVPFHGMIYNKDGTLSYIIKRFDRLVKGQKLATEDFSQILGFSRETKYAASIEKLIGVLDKHCTFPLIEKIKFFRLIIFSFLIGNEDLHLKNFSLIRRNHKVELSPAYDLLNTTIILHSKEELALPLRGKKSNLNRNDLIEYFGLERLGLEKTMIDQELMKFQHTYPHWQALIKESFLSPANQELYQTLVDKRFKLLYS